MRTLLSLHVVQYTQVSDELKRDTRFAIKVMELNLETEAPSICVTVSSAIDDIADTWSAKKTVCRIGKIRKLRSQISSPSWNTEPLPKYLHDDPFYDISDHQLIGVGFILTRR